jgi:hypothetical protein
MDQHFDPNHIDPAALLAVYGVILIIVLGIWLIVTVIVSILVSKCYAQIPEKNRAMSPGKVWLLLIPCFSIVWNFFVFPGLSKSFKSYFDSVGDTTVGDCYAQVALWYSIASACCIVPCLNYLAGPASLVLLIIYLVKAFDLKAKIKA